METKLTKKKSSLKTQKNEPELSQNGSNPDDPEPKEEESSESDD